MPALSTGAGHLSGNASVYATAYAAPTQANLRKPCLTDAPELSRKLLLFGEATPISVLLLSTGSQERGQPPADPLQGGVRCLAGSTSLAQPPYQIFALKITRSRPEAHVES